MTILLGCLTGMLLFWGMGLAWSGHLWAQIVAWFLGFFGVSVGVNLVIRRKLEAIFKDVQAHIELTQGQLRRRIAVMQNRNMGGGKAVQKLLEKDQGSAIRDAVTILDRVAPLKKWNLLAIAPHGKPVVKKDPRELKIDVDAKGRISIARTYISTDLLKSIVKKAVLEYGADTPIVIRGDGEARHQAIQSAMNACTDAGIYKIKFSVLKEKGK